jgi:HSP20 family protein
VYEHRPHGELTRSFTLPENVDLEHITSSLRDGVLYVVVPKTAGMRARKIAIGGDHPRS